MKHAAVLEAFHQLVAETGRPPSERQVARRVGCAPSTAHKYKAQLVAAGALRYAVVPDPGSAQNRTCAVCGADLTGRRRQARHCSGACRAEASRRHRLLSYEAAA